MTESLFIKFCKFVDESIFPKENRGESVAFIVDLAFIDDFCKKHSVSEDALLKDVKINLNRTSKDNHLHVSGFLWYQGETNVISDDGQELLAAASGNASIVLIHNIGELYLDGHRFFFTHGHLYDEEHLPMLKAGDVFMYGHIHKPVLKKENDITIFNPSSISLPKAGQKSFGIYENGELKIVSFDKKVLQSIKI